MLVKGDARARIRPAEVRSLSCSDHLKEIVYRCIGERRKRLPERRRDDRRAADAAARLNVGVQRSLDGVHLRSPAS